MVWPVRATDYVQLRVGLRKTGDGGTGSPRCCDLMMVVVVVVASDFMRFRI
jgi:hypothetical protein